MNKWLTACAVFFTILMACQREEYGTITNIHSDSLFITSFTPDSAHIGDEVTIIGKGFSSITNTGTVQVGTVKAQIVSSTDSIVIIRILPGTTSGKISITVGNGTATTTKTFTILPDSLKIFSFSPDSGAIGSQITIKGKNFSPAAAGNQVKINNTNAEVISGTDSTLVIKVLPGTSSGKISVTAGGQTAISALDFSITVPVVVTGTWTRKADCPGQFSDLYSGGFIGSFSINGIGYYFKNGALWAYNPLTNVWTQKASAPIPAFYGFAFAIGNKAYIGLGGFGPGPNSVRNAVQKQVWQYDPGLDTWTRKNDFPGPVRIAPFCFTTSTKGYVGGGDTAGAAMAQYNDLWQYNPQTDQWTAKARYPSTDIYKTGFSAFGIQDKGYVLEAGSNSPQAAFRTQSIVSFWQYDEASDTWSQKSSLSVLGEKIVSASCFSLQNNGYAVVGTDNITSLKNNFWQYDPSTNKWNQKPDFAGGYKLFGAGFSINGKGYVGLGNGERFGDFKKDFWEYTP